MSVTITAAPLYQSFALHGSSVSLVTVHDDDHRFFVAGSVLTASVDPFALAVSVGRAREALPAMLTDRTWALSILAAHHLPLVRQLTGSTTPAQRRVALVDAGATASPEGPLILPDALTAFWCATASSTTVHDQTLVVGDVLRASAPKNGDPLLRWNHRFHTAAALPPGADR